ncbi:class C sortase [Rathayibacter sp. YIM 133350]|uniref:class C sortase n=1 Tax=Rathayibacter sp. YIM 133350 TaxID=3131992 RepID=UPI00307D8780
MTKGGETRRRGIFQRMLVLVVAAAGLGIILYPAAGSWMSAAAISNDLKAYEQQVERSASSSNQQSLAAARAYNANIPHGALRDPYSSATSRQQATDDYQNYLRQLEMPGRYAMGTVRIPSIGVNLPIYHGTSDAALDRGAGHLYGSSLPVGGPSTHAVVTAHAGLPNATMFTDLQKVRKGDTFAVTVLDQTLYYRVDQITVTLPNDTTALDIVPGEDYVTLLTCTPINVNSHRLLVRGERIAPPETASGMVVKTNPGFPWFIPIFVAGVAVIGALLYRRRDAAQRAA